LIIPRVEHHRRLIETNGKSRTRKGFVLPCRGEKTDDVAAHHPE
jgi:hypothetical protein